jgi:succinyl-CoA synthetase beta subunit
VKTTFTREDALRRAAQIADHMEQQAQLGRALHALNGQIALIWATIGAAMSPGETLTIPIEDA